MQLWTKLFIIHKWFLIIFFNFRSQMFADCKECTKLFYKSTWVSGKNRSKWKGFPEHLVRNQQKMVLRWYHRWNIELSSVAITKGRPITERTDDHTLRDSDKNPPKTLFNHRFIDYFRNLLLSNDIRNSCTV